MQCLGSITRRRLSCAIHSLQLVVLDGLKCAKFMSLILSKISRLATLIHTTVNLSENFFKIFNHTVLTTTDKRWNSLYIQFSAVAKLDRVKLNNMLAESKQDTCSLTKREMNIVNDIVSILEPAYDATMIMQENNALVSLVAPTVVTLRTKLDSHGG
jgi:hypothetical protein